MGYPIQSSLPIGGVLTISFAGKVFLLGDDYSWSPATPERSTVSGRSGVYGYDEKARAGFIKGSAYDYNGNSVTDIGNLVGQNVIATLRNGKTITGNAGWNVDPPEVDGSGKFNFNIASPDVREVSTGA